MIRYIEVSKHILNLQLPSSVRSRIINLALAQAITTKLSLPSSEVTSPEEYYFRTFYDQVRSLVNDVNEEIPLLISEVFEQARKLYLYRYRVAFPSSVNESTMKFDYFCSLSEVDVFFSQEEFDFLCEHRVNIFAVALMFRTIFNKMASGETK